MTQNGGTQEKQKETSKELWLRFAFPTFVSLMLGIATFWIDHRISERAEQEQAARLYTQLISDREQAASGLRKDMFATILGGFLDTKDSASAEVGSKRLDKDLLKLELLALNFGETLSLGPLFAMMDRKIRTPSSYVKNIEKLDRSKFEGRLESLARRVADAQRGSLASESRSFTVEVPRDIGEVGTFEWPPDTDRDGTLACLVLERVQRRVRLVFDNINKQAKTIDVSMEIESYSLADQAPELCLGQFNECAALDDACIDHITYDYTPPTKPFTIDHFNLPLIDNSLLSEDQRLALVMRDFTDEYVEVLGVLFPGQYAGRRDKLTLDQAIESLKKGRLIKGRLK